jgi:hypothetical protein
MRLYSLCFVQSPDSEKDKNDEESVKDKNDEKDKAKDFEAGEEHAEDEGVLPHEPGSATAEALQQYQAQITVRSQSA